MTRHWTLDELTDRLYGIREEDGHLASCLQCAARLEDLRNRRAASIVAPGLSAEARARQKEAVFRRIESPSRRVPSWVPAMTAAACLAAVAFLAHQAPRVAAPAADSGAAVTAPVSDAQLFADIYSIEESDEPRAAAPIHGLFQEDQQ